MLPDPILARFNAPTREHEVTAADIRRFALAIGARNPIHTDSAVARNAGYTDVAAPHSYYVALGVTRGLADDPGLLGEDGLPRADGLESYAVMAGGARVHFLHRLVAGHRVAVTQEVVGVDEKQGRSGRLNIVRLRRTYHQQTRLAVDEQYVRILRELESA